DFIPYKYGAFSFTLQHDKQQLIRQGYLQENAGFQLGNVPPGLNKLDHSIQIQIHKLEAELRNIRGRDLLKKTYSTYPYYASNSLVAKEILSSIELDQVVQSRNRSNSPCLFTVGYEGLSIDEYLNKLIKHNVSVLIDVRNNPLSRKYGFSKTQLKGLVE